MKGNNENNKYNGSNEYQKAIDFLEKDVIVVVLQEFPKNNLQN